MIKPPKDQFLGRLCLYDTLCFVRLFPYALRVKNITLCVIFVTHGILHLTHTVCDICHTEYVTNVTQEH